MRSAGLGDLSKRKHRAHLTTRKSDPCVFLSGNLALTATEEELERLFASYGIVDRAQIITDRDTGRSRGFGFVEMPDATEAQAAIEGLNGRSLAGRTLTVNEARPRDERARATMGMRRRPRW